MKWFICFLIILMCSCKTKEIARDVSSQEQFAGDITNVYTESNTDTTKTTKHTETENYTRIEESETITIYDTDKQTPSQVTEKKKIIESVIKDKADETKHTGVNENKKDSTDINFATDTNVVSKEDVKEKSVTKGMFDNLGKYLGIGLAILIGIYWTWKKIKNKFYENI